VEGKGEQQYSKRDKNPREVDIQETLTEARSLKPKSLEP
jgi:hypothetical protein